MKDFEKNMVNEMNDELNGEEIIEKEADTDLSENATTWVEYMAYMGVSGDILDMINSQYDKKQLKKEEWDVDDESYVDDLKKMEISISTLSISFQLMEFTKNILAYAEKSVKPISREPIEELFAFCQVAEEDRNDPEALSIILDKIRDKVSQIKGLLDDKMNELSVDDPKTYAWCCEYIKTMENTIRENLKESVGLDKFIEFYESEGSEDSEKSKK